MLAAMRVAFVQPPLRVPVEYIDYPYFADVGLLQCAAAAAAAGHEITVVDAFALPTSDVRPVGAGLDLGASPETVVDAVGQARPEAVVLAHTPYARSPAGRAALAAFVAALRDAAPGAPIVAADCHVGGMHYRGHDAEQTRRELGADYVVRFEGEQAIVALLGALADGNPVPSALDGGEEADLDGLPLPSWDRIDLAAHDAFLERLVRSGRALVAPLDGRTLPVLLSRGCPYRCSFCHSNPGLAPGAPKRQRRASIPTVRRLVARLKELGATRLVVLDEIPNLEPEHFAAVVAALEAAELRFDFPNGLRADRLTPGMVARLGRSVHGLAISAESGSQRVVDEVIGKSQPLDAIRRVAREATEAGVPLRIHLLLGLPGESRSELGETLRFADELAALGAEAAVQFAIPFEGTRLADDAAAHALDLGPEEDRASLLCSRPIVPIAAASRHELVTARALLERRLGSRATRKVILNLGYRCNNRCLFCAVGDRPAIDGPLDAHLEALGRYAARGVRLLDLDGGEPTLYPELLRVLHAARALGYRRIALSTNGRRLSYPPYAASLLDAGLLDVVRVSLHGPTAESHEALTSAPGSFGQTLGGLRAVLARPTLEQGVNTTITARNLEHLGAMAGWLAELGVRSWSLQALTPFGRAGAELLPDEAAMRRTLDGLLGRWGDALGITVLNLPYCRLPGHELRLAADVDKGERHMVFVGEHGTNLARFLGERRRRIDECDGCLFEVACAGLYDFGPTAPAARPAGSPASPGEGARARGPGRLVDVIVGYRCNSGCRFCSIDDAERAAQLDPSTIAREIELARSHADRLRFGGGEPTLRRELGAWVSRARDAGYREIAIQSNGYLLSYAERVDRLIGAGVTRFDLSVRGATALTQDALTRVPGSFGLLLAAIDHLVGRGAAVHADVIVVRPNLSELDSAVELLWQRGLRSFAFWYVAPEGRAAHDLALVPRLREAAPAVARAIETALGRGARSALAYYLPRCLLPGLEPHVWDPASEDALVITPRTRFRLEHGAMDLGVKVEACAGCPEAERCIGLRPSYRALYGDDEIPGPPRRAP
jgi:MoaA/NifB/PqqE/SkfB family radical SAM enzyme